MAGPDGLAGLLRNSQTVVSAAQPSREQLGGICHFGRRLLSNREAVGMMVAKPQNRRPSILDFQIMIWKATRTGDAQTFRPILEYADLAKDFRELLEMLAHKHGEGLRVAARIGSRQIGSPIAGPTDAFYWREGGMGHNKLPIGIPLCLSGLSRRHCTVFETAKGEALVLDHSDRGTVISYPGKNFEIMARNDCFSAGEDAFLFFGAKILESVGGRLDLAAYFDRDGEGRLQVVNFLPECLRVADPYARFRRWLGGIVGARA